LELQPLIHACPKMNARFEASKLAWSALSKAQPSGRIPAWIILNATKHVVGDGQNRWVFNIYLFRKRILGPGEYWHPEDDGTKTLRRVDPLTGQHSVLIHYGSEEDRVPLFEVTVDLDSSRVFILRTSDVSGLDRNEFELHCDEAISREKLRSRLDAESYSLVFGDDE
jgi:hypothetical protein